MFWTSKTPKRTYFYISHMFQHFFFQFCEENLHYILREQKKQISSKYPDFERVRSTGSSMFSVPKKICIMCKSYSIIVIAVYYLFCSPNFLLTTDFLIRLFLQFHESNQTYLFTDQNTWSTKMSGLDMIKTIQLKFHWRLLQGVISSKKGVKIMFHFTPIKPHCITQTDKIRWDQDKSIKLRFTLP